MASIGELKQSSDIGTKIRTIGLSHLGAFKIRRFPVQVNREFDLRLEVLWH